MPHKYQFYETSIANKNRLNIKRAVSNLKIPQLIIHGTNDEVVLPIEAKNIYKWNPKSTLIMINNMNHSLGCFQPYTKKSMPKDLELVVKETIKFINH